MKLHPLTPRRAAAPARVMGTLAGIAAFVVIAILMIEVVPITAWLPHVDMARTADLWFFSELISTLVSRDQGLLASTIDILSLPISVAHATSYLGIDVSVAIRGTGALLAAGVIGASVHKLQQSAALAVPDVEHVKGAQLLSGGEAKRSLLSHWRRRFGVAIQGIELADDIVMPRQLETEHFLVVGGTGAGKTTVLEKLMDGALAKGDRVLALDIKGDVTARLPTDDFCLLALEDVRSARWLIGLDIRTPADAVELASELIPDTSDPSWSGGARQILAAAIEYLQRQSMLRGKTWNWSHLDRLLTKPVGDLHSLLVGSHPVAAALIDVSKEETRKQAMSFYIVLIANAGHLVKACAGLGHSRGRSLSIRRWAEGGNGQVLILRQSQRLPELSAVMIRIALKVIADTIAAPTTTADQTPTWLFLDELPQIGHSATIPRLAAIGRSAGVRMVAAIQSPAQLREIYGIDGSQQILDNLTTKIVGRVASGSTASDIATQWIGYRTVSWWEEQGVGSDGKPRLERQTKDIPVVEPQFLTDELGLTAMLSMRRTIRALVVGHADVALLTWSVGRWPVRRSPVEAAVQATTRLPSAKQSSRRRCYRKSRIISPASL